MSQIRQAAERAEAAAEEAFQEGEWASGMPYFRLGLGRPMLFLPGLTPNHRRPAGMERMFQMEMLKPYGMERQAWWVNRRPGLASGATMADIARDYAEGMRARFDGPVDVVGNSTGGSIALQLAADHPDLVRRLVLISAAHRLGDEGRRAQQLAADELRAGRPDRAGSVIASMMGTGTVSTAALSFAGRFYAKGTEADMDMLRTIEAENLFDIKSRLGEIQAPTLVVGGALDRFYGADLFRETAAGIRDARLVLYPNRGHMSARAGRRMVPGVLGFLRGSASGSASGGAGGDTGGDGESY